MKKIVLGGTGIEVTELCFGALPIGPLQKDVPVEEAAETIARALEKGISFIDTAQGYKTYPHIRKAIEATGIRPVIASKSMRDDYAGMEEAVQECLDGLGIDCVDIFYLHAARAGADVFQARAGALRCLLDCKARGRIRAVGISTHDVLVTELAAGNPDIDMVFPILNNKGLGILGGGRAEMERAIEACFAAGKGVCLMKALGGGNLGDTYAESMDYARGFLRGRGAVALGMVNIPEVEVAAAYFDGRDITRELAHIEVPRKRFIVLKLQCLRCGRCVESCHSGAITLEEGYPVFDRSRCLTCGYCVTGCPRFAIRMV